MSTETAVGAAALPLSFVYQDGTSTCFWRPDRDGEYAEQNARGRAYALELQCFMHASGNAQLFGSVIRAIVGGGIYGAVEIGFCSIIGSQLFAQKPVNLS